MKHINAFYAALVILSLCVGSAFTPSKETISKAFLGAFNGNLIDLDTVLIHLDDCNSKGSLCLPLTLGQAFKNRIYDNGELMDISIMNGCDFDTSSAYTYSTLFGLGQFGPYILTSWPVSSMVFSDTFNTIPELVDSMNSWDPNGDWVLDASHLLITGGFPGNTYDTMKVWVTQISSPSYIGYNIGITPNGTSLEFERGFHTVVFEDTTTLERDTFYVHATCSDAKEFELYPDSMAIYCMDLTDLLTAPESVTLCNNQPSTVVNFMLNPTTLCVSMRAIQVGYAENCIIVCDSTGFCDTTYLSVHVIQPGGFTSYYQETTVGGTGTVCLDTTNLNSNVQSVTVCEDLGNSVDFQLDPITHCIHYTGLIYGGIDTICFTACDAIGICDTTQLIVRVRRSEPAEVFDTLYINQAGVQCLDLLNLTGLPDSLITFCDPQTPVASYNLDTINFCVQYSATAVGTDTLCLHLVDALGNTDTTYFYLTVIKPALEVVYDTLNVDETGIFCLSTAELSASPYSITNFCSNSGGQNVEFVVNDVSLCLEIQGISAGTDTACIALCDANSVCDTLILIVTALDVVNPQLPVANPDNHLTAQGTPVVIPVFDNDLIASAVTDWYLIPAGGSSGPSHGVVSISGSDGIITYTPDSSFCNGTDNFQYAVCNQYGCDTTLVTVMVYCNIVANDSLIVYNGFSPNNDQINDTFTIVNIEKYLGNKLYVYNRWGNQVYFKEAYNNTWTGDWNGIPLPDGTYFYVLHDGLNHTLKGTITLHR